MYERTLREARRRASGKGEGDAANPVSGRALIAATFVVCSLCVIALAAALG